MLVCVSGAAGRKEIPSVQSHLTSSGLGLQAGIGLLSHLELVV